MKGGALSSKISDGRGPVVIPNTLPCFNSQGTERTSERVILIREHSHISGRALPLKPCSYFYRSLTKRKTERGGRGERDRERKRGEGGREGEKAGGKGNG